MNQPINKEAVSLIIKDMLARASTTTYKFSGEDFNLIMQLDRETDETKFTNEQMTKLLKISADVKKTEMQLEQEQRQQQEAKQEELEKMKEKIHKAIFEY